MGHLARMVNRYPTVSMAILLLTVFAAVLAPFISPHSPVEGNLSNQLLPPAWLPGGSMDYLLGTDKLGRDLLSRIIYGARVSLAVSLVGVVFAGTIGTALGLIAGYYGGRADQVLMRIVDISLSLPPILLALVLAASIGPSFTTVIAIIGLLLWSRFARLVRGETLSIRERDFIARARVAGASDLRIMLRHIFPNVANSLVVLSTLQVGHVILLEATLSFLNVGIPPPNAAWGLMVADGRELIIVAWWVSVFPGLAIALTVLSVNIFGDWLRDRLDPTQSRL